MLKHYFLVYEKHNMIFQLWDACCMHKNIFSNFFLYFWKFWRKLSILISDSYFYEIKYRLILSKKTYSKRWKSHKILKINFFWTGPDPTQFSGLGRTRPKCMGWAQPSKERKRNSGSPFIVHMQHEQRGVTKKEGNDGCN